MNHFDVPLYSFFEFWEIILAAFWGPFGVILGVPGGSGTRSGFQAFPDSSGAAQGRLWCAPGAFLAGVLEVSWGRLGASKIDLKSVLETLSYK